MGKRVTKRRTAMRKVILGGLAAVALTLGLTASQASAAWVTRPVTIWDANCGRYVTTTQTYWVPNPVVVVRDGHRGVYHRGEYRGRHVEHRGYHHH
jgi:hypothetical protein